MKPHQQDSAALLQKWRIDGDSFFMRAIEEAGKLHHGYLGVEHLFIAMTKTNGPTQSMLHGFGKDPTQIRDSLRRELGQGKGQGETITVTSRLLEIYQAAQAEISDGKAPEESQLLVAMLEEGHSLPIRYLLDCGIDLKVALKKLKQSKPQADADQTMVSVDPTMATMIPGASIMQHSTEPPLQHGESHVGEPIKPKPAIPTSLPTPTLDLHGRDLTKLARLGKLADAIGRESELNQNQVPPVLRGKRIVEIQMSTLTAGTSLRGQFEDRIRTLVKEATEASEVILFIDEFHTIVGAGSSSDGSNDVAQMMKPALARGDISCIGATTQDEFNRFIRKDPALERRFSPVTIKEMTAASTFAVLEKVVPNILEKQAQAGYNLEVDSEALRTAIFLTDKYIKDRNQPDKSIDALDIACARAIVHGKAKVTAIDIADVVSEWTGIPTGNLSQDEIKRYARMEETLSYKVKGQETAITALSRSIRTALAGLKTANRPVGVFLFMGPSGVGKTMLAKELAACLFGGEEALIRFDMTEYQEKHTVSNLIGSSRGYVGSEQGGQFTEALRRNPYSVVLLDEIEKAHPDVFNIFLPVFDDGRITDNQGRTIDCSHAVFIMTSNLGAGEIDFSDTGPSALREKASKFLKPELVNRINEVIGFLPLGPSEMEAILDSLLMEKVKKFEASQGISLEFDASIKQAILGCNFNPRMGARPLDRAVEQMIVQPLVDIIYRRELSSNKVRVVFRDGQIIFESEGK